MSEAIRPGQQYGFNFCDHDWKFVGEAIILDVASELYQCSKCGECKCDAKHYFQGIQSYIETLSVDNVVREFGEYYGDEKNLQGLVNCSTPGDIVTINEQHVFHENKFSSLDNHHLQVILNQCIIDEAYEDCAEIRDELERRKKSAHAVSADYLFLPE